MPISRRVWITLVCVLVLTAVMLSTNEQPLLAQNGLPFPSVALSLNKKTIISLSPSNRDVQLSLKVPVAADVVVVLDSPEGISYSYNVMFPDQGGSSGRGMGHGPVAIRPDGSTDLWADVPANSTALIALGQDYSDTYPISVTVVVYLVQPHDLGVQNSVAGQVTPGMPVAEYVFDAPEAPLAVRVTGNKTGAFAIVDGHILKDYPSGRDLYDSCTAWQYDAEYEMVFIRGLDGRCHVVLNRADIRGLALFQIQASAYHPVSLDSGPQIVTVSPQNPIMLWTFKEAAGEPIELAIKRLSEVILDVDPIAADSTSYGFEWVNNRGIIPLASYIDGMGYVFVMLEKNSQRHVAVQISLKHGIILL